MEFDRRSRRAPATGAAHEVRSAHREFLGRTSAGKSAHLRDLGLSVELHTVVGDDPAGTSIRQALSRAAIPAVLTRVDGASERHLNLMDPRGGRVSIYLDVPARPDAAVERQAVRQFLDAVSRAQAAVLDLSQASRDIIEPVTALGVPIWVDLHDYDGTSEFHAPFVRAGSFIFMNADRLTEPLQFLHACIQRGAEVAVCTLGAEGAVAVDATGHQHHVAATPVPRVLDTNGAGDGFMAGFISAHLAGAHVRDALTAGADQAARALGTVHMCPNLDAAPETPW